MTLDMFIETKTISPHPLRFFAPKDSHMASIKSQAWTFCQFSTALELLARELAPRVSIRQVLVFSLIVEKAAMGHDITIAEIRDKAGRDKKGEELLGKSLGRSYQVFLKPTKREPDNLGWCYVEEDENDRRRKLLRLTEEGEAIALRLASALKMKS